MQNKIGLYHNELYLSDVKYVASLKLPWERLSGSSILVSGASGLIASFLIDVIMYKNDYGLNCRVFALSRNTDRAFSRFEHYWNSPLFNYISHDINSPLVIKNLKKIGYVLHLASNTHPVAYATDPIGTITTNVLGTNNMLSFASNYNADRFLFSSSNEIYGENRGDTELYDESYCGYIDSNTMRAGYPEGKRCGEALCQAYMAQKKLDVVVARLTRSFGPTMIDTDRKAISQFIMEGVSGHNIILKSSGNQYYSYSYVSDAVSGLLTTLMLGHSGEAYNIADKKADIRLKDLAQIIADITDSEVIFELPDAIEKAGFSVATKARLNGNKLKKLGWSMRYDIQSGLQRTVDVLRYLRG